ncbi:3-deoxy-manno-octulosonate cytidylyltransferase [Aureispira anguillae]|uniref:3-deoxy-manno-octulosonate cytidylyltransferase n=1 Tax=Aureispira anguillae TaxID=2864201 RepID=A0A915YF93_9BACT|nr:3-deoxy-manno-octulosonate cytidylyltransferase [Aureispira anguillae]BDS11962.1 3-deoxy-manno-octulosonate cytidylyltransferase [Aureispira anguillae]
MSKSIGIIPARYASSRFPGKPLVDIAGKSMIQRVYEQVALSKLDQVIVATDDQRIYDTVKKFGGKVVMTGQHENGTSRCIEAFLKTDQEYDILVNIQGDEPFIQPAQINAALAAFKVPQTSIATLAKRVTHLNDLLNSNVVKVAFSNPIETGVYNALYFSRSPIPFVRDLPQEEWLAQHHFYKHIGLYAFSRSFLIDHYPHIKPSRLEAMEMLEQLSWLENGYAIRILETTIETPNIDTPKDLEIALDWLKSNPLII